MTRDEDDFLHDSRGSRLTVSHSYDILFKKVQSVNQGDEKNAIGLECLIISYTYIYYIIYCK